MEKNLIFFAGKNTNRLKSIIQEKNLGEAFYIIHPKLSEITISLQIGDKCSVESELRGELKLWHPSAEMDGAENLSPQEGGRMRR